MLSSQASNELFSFVKKSTIFAKVVIALLLIGYAISFSDPAVRALSVTPGRLFPPSFWVWTLVTQSVIETHIWNVLIDIVVLALYERLLEPVWGSMEMTIFYFVVNSATALLTTIVYLFMFMVSFNSDFLFEVHINGLAGYIAAFCVAVKQIMPEHVFFSSPIGKLKNGHIPLLLLTVSIILRLVKLIDPTYPIMFAWGLLVSWVYLRFYQKHNNGTKGDHAENFTFASFFPNVLQPFIGVIANTLFQFLVSIKICKQSPKKYNVGAPSHITITLPGTDPADVERRRKKAIKALDDRLKKAEKAAWPELEGEGSADGREEANTSTAIDVTVGDEEEGSSSAKDEQEKSVSDTAAV